MRTRFNSLLWALLIIILVIGCKKENNPICVSAGPYANGAFIINEGTFGQTNASVSYYDFVGDSIRGSIFETVNKHPLGQLLQSMYSINGKVYMVLNLSDTVVIANAGDFKETGVISGLSSPRWMTSCGGKGYITQWGEGGAVKVTDLNTNAILATIHVGTGPEQATVAGGKILVCNGGAYTVDSTISVIDPITDQVVQTIEAGHNPKEMVVDKNNDIWVICYGYIEYDLLFNIILETPSKLVKLSGKSFQKLNEFIISATRHPQHIGISKDKATIYYGGGFGFAGIYSMDISSNVLPSSPLVDGGKYFYGFGVNPENNEIFAFDATDFTTSGILSRYSPAGSWIKNYTVGVAPNGAVFK